MKKGKKQKKKMTPMECARMWGEDVPYSQVRLCEETRILGNGVSRIFLVVEAEINPFTFEKVGEYREHFSDDMPVLQLLDHGEDRGKFGFVVGAGEVELRDEEAIEFARKQADMTIATLIRMHAFVMDMYELKSDDDYGVVEDGSTTEGPYVWNEKTASVEMAGGEVWEEKTKVGSPAGVQNNKARMFIAFSFYNIEDLNKPTVNLFADTLKSVSADFNVDIEEVELFHEHAIITALIPFDVAPVTFIETVLGSCNEATKKPLFRKFYLVTNVKRPTPEQIMSFVAQARDSDSK
jgi:hypothetical protein